MSTHQENKITEIASKHLGQKGGEGYSDTYDPSLLVRIPRSLNREAYDIKEDELPFLGIDVWNAYEVSALTTKGLPVAGMLKIICDAASKYHVESKSLKLYLNSFNMTRMGENSIQCIETIQKTVEQDLTQLLESSVLVRFYDEPKAGNTTIGYFNTNAPHESIQKYVGYQRIQSLVPDIDDIEFTAYHSDATQLEYSGMSGTLQVSIDFLRSNCRVTHQPDWGTLYLHIKAENLPDLKSIAKYVVSHRKVSHFHEEIVEMVYKHLWDRFTPEELMVCALYTRRGGIDINPCRATDQKLIPMFMKSPDVLMGKTLMQ